MCIFSYCLALCKTITRGPHRVRKEFRASSFGEPHAITALPRFLAVCHIAVIVLLPRPRLVHIPLPLMASRLLPLCAISGADAGRE